MMDSAYSPIPIKSNAFSDTHLQSPPNNVFPLPKRTKRSNLLFFITKVLILLLCYHALQHHKFEKEVEIEEEEPELVVVTNPSSSRKARKGHA